MRTRSSFCSLLVYVFVTFYCALVCFFSVHVIFFEFFFSSLFFFSTSSVRHPHRQTTITTTSTTITPAVVAIGACRPPVLSANRGRLVPRPLGVGFRTPLQGGVYLGHPLVKPQYTCAIDPTLLRNHAHHGGSRTRGAARGNNNKFDVAEVLVNTLDFLSVGGKCPSPVRLSCNRVNASSTEQKIVFFTEQGGVERTSIIVLSKMCNDYYFFIVLLFLPLISSKTRMKSRTSYIYNYIISFFFTLLDDPLSFDSTSRWLVHRSCFFFIGGFAFFLGGGSFPTLVFFLSFGLTCCNKCTY